MDTRNDNWNRLDALLRQAESTGVKSLSVTELRELGLLYRQTAADLSAVRTDRTSRMLEQYLNRLVGRAHNFVYSGRRISPVGLWNFMAHGYPRLLRRLSGYVYLAIAITLVTAIFGMLITLVQPDFAQIYVGPDMMATINQHKMWTDSLLAVKPAAASGIMTNNIWVCFLTFAGGVIGGLGTVALLYNNGMMLGVIATLCAQHGMSLSLWSFIASHGALELPSIMLAGAAGLRLGAGILFPGLLRRRESIAVGGLEAVQLVAGTVPLLVIAGTLEAFLSPTAAPVALKFSVGAFLFIALMFWLTEGGRRTVETTA